MRTWRFGCGTGWLEEIRTNSAFTHAVATIAWPADIIASLDGDTALIGHTCSAGGCRSQFLASALVQGVGLIAAHGWEGAAACIAILGTGTGIGLALVRSARRLDITVDCTALGDARRTSNDVTVHEGSVIVAARRIKRGRTDLEIKKVVSFRPPGTHGL